MGAVRVGEGEGRHITQIDISHRQPWCYLFRIEFGDCVNIQVVLNIIFSALGFEALPYKQWLFLLVK